MNFPAHKGYKLSQAATYLRKARQLLKDVEMLNEKLNGDFRGLLDFCGENAFLERQKLKAELENVQ